MSAKTHPTNEGRGKGLGIIERFNQNDIAMQIALVHAAKGTEERAQRGTCAFAGITMHFASAIAVIIACPLAQAMGHGAVVAVNTGVGTPFITGQQGSRGRDRLV